MFTLCVHNVAGVVMEYFLAKLRGVDVGVNLGSANILVPQHSLNGPQVGTALQQGSGKTVPQSVGRYGFGDTCLHCLPLYHDKYHGACEVMTAPVQKHVVLLTGLDVEPVTVEKPQVELLYGSVGYGHKALFATFTGYLHELLLQEEL